MRKKDAVQDGSVRDFYWKVLEAKQNNEPWAIDYRVDQTTQRSIQGTCLACGNPDLSGSMSGAECKKCGINRLINTYGFSKEAAEKEYDHRQSRKEITMNFYEMARKKRVSNNKRIAEEDVLF
jgi:hypothetical protein